jgi:hypothetical protein
MQLLPRSRRSPLIRRTLRCDESCRLAHLFFFDLAEVIGCLDRFLRRLGQFGENVKPIPPRPLRVADGLKTSPPPSHACLKRLHILATSPARSCTNSLMIFKCSVPAVSRSDVFIRLTLDARARCHHRRIKRIPIIQFPSFIGLCAPISVIPLVSVVWVTEGNRSTKKNGRALRVRSIDFRL